MAFRLPPSPLRLRIDEVAFGGRGVGRLEDGRVVFVPFVAAGESVRVEIVREHRSYLEARLLEVEEPSPRRVEPPCPYFGRCGGCSYQHLDDAEQRDTKRRQVESVLRRIGKLEHVAVEATVPSPRDYGYRNRITVHAHEEAVGFFGHDEAGRRALIDIERCPIAEDAVNAALARFRANPRRREGHCTLRADTAHAGGFEQTNDGAAALLLALVTRRLFPGEAAEGGAAPPTCLIDAYCGAGFFARYLSARFGQVIGLEWDRRAVAQARRQAAPHERYLDGDVGELLPAALAAAPLDATALVVDPPAEGLAEPVRRAVLATPPAAMVYVSCNPSTLARDLAALGAVYEVGTVTPLDMFPQTAEIEVVTGLRRRAGVR